MFIKEADIRGSLIHRKGIKGFLEHSGIILGVLFLTFVAMSVVVEQGLTEIFVAFFNATFGGWGQFLSLLVKFSFILIATLGLIVAFKTNLFNIGGEGQIITGIIVGVGICLYFPGPPTLVLLLAFIMSFVAGGAYGAIAGVLKAKWGVDEIIFTMMQNFVMIGIFYWLIDGPWYGGSGLYPKTEMIPAGTRLPYLEDPLTAIFIIAIVLVPVVYFLLHKTTIGYEFLVTGRNRTAAFTRGIDVRKVITLSMFTSAGICALAGTGLVVGEYFRAQRGMSGQYGFFAIATAFMAKQRPELAILSAFFVATIIQGAIGLTVVGLPERLGWVLVGVSFIASLVPGILEGRR
jgi:simple sugar transport system permease protein